MDQNETILSRNFYQRMDALQISRDLLGKVIETSKDGTITAATIVETEAYMAPEDLACHARGNRRTPRTENMFLPGGHAYVYICYGIHYLFNIVTAVEGVAHVVLVRAVEPHHNLEEMKKRRGMENVSYSILNGPGKLTVALGIDKDHDGIDITSKDSPIVIKDIGNKIPNCDIITGPRVGMSHHTQHSGHYPWRFRIKGNKWTSKPDKVKYEW